MTPTLLSEYRWDKASAKLKERLTEAERIAEVYGNYDMMRKVRQLAIMEYIESVPELRRLKQGAKQMVVNKIGFVHSQLQ